MTYFEDFDFSTFWDNSPYALKSYVAETPTDELIQSIEEELGYKLPASYIHMMKIQNGGIPHNTCFPTQEPTSWAGDHVSIHGFPSIGRDKDYSLGGGLGSQFMIDEWGYPAIGVVIGDCPSAGHDVIMLDYRNCGKDGEPEVIHVDQEADYEITFLAKDFETFVRGLVNEELFDTSEEDLADDLQSIQDGEFSSLLKELISFYKPLYFDPILRKILYKLTEEKGYFALHADELSYLVYDIQFLLYTNHFEVPNMKEYLGVYDRMIALPVDDCDICTCDYAESFLSDWASQRKSEIIQVAGRLQFSDTYTEQLIKSLEAYQ